MTDETTTEVNETTDTEVKLEDMLYGDDENTEEPKTEEEKSDEQGEKSDEQEVSSESEEESDDSESDDSSEAEEKTSESESDEKEGGEEEKEEEKSVEDFELKLPKDSRLDESHVDGVRALAKDANLTEAQAKAILLRDHKAAIEAHEAQEAFLDAKAEEWEGQCSNDPEFGGDKWKGTQQRVKQFVNRFGTEALKESLNASALGSHPEVVRLINRAAMVMSDDTLVFSNNNAAPKEKAIEDIIYDDNGTKKE